MNKLEFSILAQNDLRFISAYSIRHWGQSQANHYAAALQKAFETIVSYPHIGKPLSGGDADMRRFAVQQHIIFYHIQPRVIHITRIMHERMRNLLPAFH